MAGQRGETATVETPDQGPRKRSRNSGPGDDIDLAPAAAAAGDAPAAAANIDNDSHRRVRLDELQACFTWELARFLAAPWTRHEETDAKKRAAMCHCTFLENYLAIPGMVGRCRLTLGAHH